jgi:hypothetical protein
MISRARAGLVLRLDDARHWDEMAKSSARVVADTRRIEIHL